MLDEGVHRGGHHLAVMRFLLPARLMASHPLGPVDDGGQGYLYSLSDQTVPDRRVVVAGDGKGGVVYELLLLEDGAGDPLLPQCGDPGRRGPAVLHAEAIRILSVFPEQGEEACLAYPQDLLHLPALQVFLQVSLEQGFYLFGGESPVDLLHVSSLRPDCFSRLQLKPGRAEESGGSSGRSPVGIS
ncbi:MAG: hypothetical protein AB1384_05135 [Actinomycetota bacterium]